MCVCACSCVFVWRLSPQLTIRMRQRLADLRPPPPLLTLRPGSGSGSGSTSAPAPRVPTPSSNSDKEEEQEEAPSGNPAHSSQVSERLALPSGPRCCPPAPVPVEQAGARTPRRRWSSREAGSEDELLMVKSMLDLRMLESYSAEEDEQLEVPHLRPTSTQSVVELTVAPPPPQVATPTVHSGSCLRGTAPVPEVGRIRSKQELGSTVSLQVTSAWVSPAPRHSCRRRLIGQEAPSSSHDLQSL